MLEQILALAESNLQLITAALIFAAVVLELVHIGQVRRINKKMSYAGRWLQKYLNAVFNEETMDETEDEEQERGTEEIIQVEGNEVYVEAAQRTKSQQEENMRVSLAHKKQQKNGELLDTVLQEIFD